MANGAQLPNGISWTVVKDQLVITIPLESGDWAESKSGKTVVKSSGGFQPAGHGRDAFSLNVTRPNDQ